MDSKIVGNRIKEVREKRNLTQEELADKVDLSPTHISVIERGLKVPKLDNFVAIANALDVSADELLFDVVDCFVLGTTNQLSEIIGKLSVKEQRKIIGLVRYLVEE
jgi:transcriptional regulator with XRE-family HTH domain